MEDFNLDYLPRLLNKYRLVLEDNLVYLYKRGEKEHIGIFGFHYSGAIFKIIKGDLE